MSALGVIDPATGIRQVWQPDCAINFLTDLQADERFNRDQYCARCIDYDKELAIQPHQLELPWQRPGFRRRSVAKIEPVSLPWQSKKPSADVKVNGRHKSRPGRPQSLDACQLCLLSFLDHQDPPYISKEQARALKDEFREARSTVARLYRAKANKLNSPVMAQYIERLLGEARTRLRRAANACRDAGFEPARRAERIGDDGPDEVITTEWVRPELVHPEPLEPELYDHLNVKGL